MCSLPGYGSSFMFKVLLFGIEIVDYSASKGLTLTKIL